MTAITIEGRTYVPESRFRRARRAMAAGVAQGVRRLVSGVPAVVKARAPLSVAHVREHAYSIAGFGCIDAAAFTHSLFTGLIVLGVSFFLYEWKVSE